MADRVEFTARDRFTPVLEKIIKKAKETGHAFDVIKDKFVAVDAKGKATRATLTGITTAGDTLSLTLKKLKDGSDSFSGSLKLTVQSAEQAIHQIQRLVKAREALNLASAERRIGVRQSQDFVRQRISREDQLGTGASSGELQRFAVAKAALIDFVKIEKVNLFTKAALAFFK